MENRTFEASGSISIEAAVHTNLPILEGYNIRLL
jgi:hypothetical protein